MDQDVLNKVMALLAEQADMDVSELSPESGLMDDLGLNSMEIMGATASLEKLFRVRIPEKAIRLFVTVADVAGYIESKL